MKGKIWKSLVVLSTLVVLGAAGWGSYTIVHYLRTSPRFEVKKVSVVGLKRVEVHQVLSRAGLADKANVFSVNLEEVRERIEGLKWVRFATVQRLLPDTIGIKIVERQPVGLARMRGSILQFDAEGELLEQDRGTGVNFPILDGLSAKDIEGNQKKVELYLKIMEDLHGQSELSEIHINDEGEVSVVSLTEPLLVKLGASDFRGRWARYLQLRARIQQDYPEAVQVDFRFKDQVILKMNADAPDEQKVVWDAGKRSL
jgi:cell division protein FtsQ